MQNIVGENVNKRGFEFLKYTNVLQCDFTKLGSEVEAGEVTGVLPQKQRRRLQDALCFVGQPQDSSSSTGFKASATSL